MKTEEVPDLAAVLTTLAVPLAAGDGQFSGAAGVEVLKQDAGVALYRVTTRPGASALVAVASVASSISPRAARRLSREYELRHAIDPVWGVAPRGLSEHQGRLLLLLADPGGELLQDRLTDPVPLEIALQFGLAVARALDGLHHASLVHCDLKPQNVLVDADGRAWLTGFGMTASVQDGAAAVGGSEAIEGTFAYMAPERTGRIGRTVDGRADLYSLGIMLYQMLAGAGPFHACEPAEWVHCHLAQRPLPPSERAAGVPAQVSRIVMKLLEKDPEDRYQSAARLAGDLACCLSYLQQGDEIGEFPLSAGVAGSKLEPGGRLYGREEEVSAMACVLERVRNEATPAFVLVSGHSGVGKSSLVEAFRRSTGTNAACFAAGKFDQYLRDIPYASLSQCFDAMVRQVLSYPAAEREAARLAIETALGQNGKLIANLVPSLEDLIGVQPELPPLNGEERQARFQSAIRQFLRVFATAGRPLILFLDDLQWLDDATLGFLEEVASRRDVPHVLWIGAYRSADADMTPSLARTLEAISSSDAIVHQLAVEPLDPSSMTALVMAVLACDAMAATPLVSLLLDKTGGNPYFATQFLLTLADRGLLRFEPTQRRWQWQLDEIRELAAGRDVIDLTRTRLQSLPDATRRTLATFACLGNAASIEVLAVALGVDAQDADALLRPAIRASLIVSRGEGYAFAHDHVQEAAYGMMSPAQRSDIHLLVGHRLLRQASPDQLADRAFDIATHFLQAKSCLASTAEKHEAAALMELAGDKARAASAYASALAFFSAGDDLMASADGGHLDARRDQLGFSLAWKRADCEFLTGQIHAAEERLAAIDASLDDLRSLATVAALRVTLYTASDRSDRAIDTGLKFLRRIGLSWNERPSSDDVRNEYEALVSEIGPPGIEALSALAPLSEPRQTAVLDVLAAMLPPAFFSDEKLVCLILCRMARISVQHGNTDASSLAYAYLGMVIGPGFGDYAAAYRFGKLGYDLVETRGLVRYKPRVYMTFAYHVMPWTRPLAAGDSLLRRAFDEAVQCGDLTYAGYSSCTLVSSRIAAGAPLIQVEREADEKLAHVRSTKFGLIVDIISAQRQMVRALRGATRSLVTFDDEAFSEARFEAHLTANRSLDIAACWYWIRKLQSCIYGGCFEDALSAARRAEPLLWSTAGHLEYAEYHFFAGLAHAGCHAGSPVSERQAHGEAVATHLRHLATWAEYCPSNFGSRAALLTAERERLEGRVSEAMQYCEKAIQLAAENGRIHDEALAYEYAARRSSAQGLDNVATALLVEAARCYGKWGAQAKVAAITETCPQVLAKLPGAGATEDATVETSPDALDLHAIIGSLQAVSGQASLARVIDSVMAIALEHAGAERGVLILPAEKSLRCRAQARIGAGGVTVAREDIEVETARVPMSVVQAAIRQNASVLINDARESNPFGDDPYFAIGTFRSVLCLPLRRHTETIGLLYLENGLISHAFTPSRLAVLQLIASTAAISIENAGLDEKTVLLKEVHHRVKNNLQLISSLLSLQAGGVKDPEIAALFAESRDRVRSIALVHENLYRAGNFARVAMHAHLRNLCAQIARAYRPPHQDVMVRVEADDIELDIGRAISCGLIINELVSNALKHGFADGRDGTVTVRLRSTDSEYCLLEVADDGIGAGLDGRARGAPGLGLELVGDLVAQLGGTQCVSHDAGMTVQIVFSHPRQED